MNPKVKYAFDSPSIQKAMNIFVFLLAFPGFELLGNSFYFYVFLWLLYKTYKRTGVIFNAKSSHFRILAIMFAIGVLSTVLQPPLMPGGANALSSLIFIMRYSYWFAISVYFFSWSKYVNLYQLSRYVVVGYLFQILGFYLLNFKIDLVILSMNTGMSRNGFVFNSIAFSGFIYYYFYQRYGRKAIPWVSLGVLLNLFFTNGRAGAIVGLLVVMMSYAVLSVSVNRLFKGVAIASVMIALLGGFQTNRLYQIGGVVAPYVQNINPRFASLLSGTGTDGDLDIDKSWLIRELMVSKAKEIISVHPIIGIGYGNFTKYDAPLEELHTAKFDRLRGKTKEFYNTRSGHNGYVEYVSENGLLGFFLFLLLIVPVFFKILRIIWTRKYKRYGKQVLILASFFGVTIHLYSIASLTGANYWFLLGVSAAILQMGESKKVVSQK